jgi:hypothetical protein
MRTGRDEVRLRAEIEEHLAPQTIENLRAGLPPGCMGFSCGRWRSRARTCCTGWVKSFTAVSRADTTNPESSRSSLTTYTNISGARAFAGRTIMASDNRADAPQPRSTSRRNRTGSFRRADAPEIALPADSAECQSAARGFASQVSGVSGERSQNNTIWI